MSPEERIRMLMDENAMLRARLDGGPMDIGELDTSGLAPAPMAMPTLDQISTPVYATNARPFGYGSNPQYTMSPSKAPSSRDRIAAALQKRRQVLGRP